MAINPQPGAEFLPPEPDPPKPWWIRVIYALGAAVAVGGMLWLSGFYQQSFVRRTADTARPLITSSPQAETTIAIPLRVFLVINSDGEGSSRTITNVESLIEKTAEIWHQASIELKFEPSSLEIIELSAEQVRGLTGSPRETIPRLLPGWSTAEINIVLVRAIPEGVNGFALPDLNTTLVADFTSVFDFRTLAHEIGHVLTLDHVEDPNRLMFPGSNGLSFSAAEIDQARAATAQFSR